MDPAPISPNHKLSAHGKGLEPQLAAAPHSHCSLARADSVQGARACPGAIYKSPVAKVRVSLLESDPVSSLDSARGAFYLDTHAHTSARVHTHARTHSAARCQPPGASTSSLLTHTIRAPGTRFSTSPPCVLKTRRVASSAIGVRFMSMGDRFHRRGWGGLE